MFTQRIGLILMLLGAFPCLSQGKDYELPTSKTVEEAVDPELRTGPHYRIEPPVQHDGYMHTYTVASDYGIFLARGDAMLRRLRRELTTIADLRERYTAGVAAESAFKVLVEPVQTVGRLALEPKDTVVGIPRGAYRLMESVIAGAMHDSGSYEDSYLKNLARVSAYKRRFAAYYHVDVYSSNPMLQIELDRVGWASLVGYTSTFAIMLVPVPNPLPLALASLNSVEVLNRALEEYGPADLRMLNLRHLKAMGVREDMARKFLDHPFYSPRHQSVIVSCLDALPTAKRRDRFVTVALNALSEDEALFYQQAAELLRAYNEQVLPIAEITILGRIALGRSKERTLFFPAPVDEAIWMQKTEALFDRLAKTLRPKKEQLRVDLWVTGRVSPRVRQELLNRGIVARENMAQELALAD
ncbi:MAG TPA: hypothetical protein VJR69_14235 [Nitrospira sp.]|nr:hypothetical protein [Nitrospira sp.]